MVTPTVALQSGVELGPEMLPLLLVVAGLGLSIAEAMAPGAHFAVLGVALLGAGIVGLLLGPVAGPLVLAALVLVFGVLALVGYRRFDLYGDSGSGQTTDSDSLRGRTGHVTERVTSQQGSVKLDRGGFDPNYAARSMDGEIPVGTEILVVDPGGGNVLTVTSMADIEDDIDAELERGRTTEADDDREDEPEHA
ncbi:Membrane protein implicated in regulation of membrane protease activity [Haloplanus vescus]|uniref:Membrane protein implicated in regulation of membrane protease activity n=1 Tax=Haloplanus vescus TaxID=555874 RepID=A0A1H3WU91_9EURY|nr:NfeD family protein [Haloplanus vescus]SDZ89934.1 Membrane protein implicated in regulation of membrane protease activity [Haloplanus vescus]